MSDGIVEVRDYTIEAEWFDAYRQWATDRAGPWLLANLDLVDFWCDDGQEALVHGTAPSVSPNGQPNVCWVIRWPDRAARDEGFKAFQANPEWQKIWAEHPNTDAYLQVNVRFMRSVC